MDFGLFFLMQRDERWSEQAVYGSALEQMLAAESLGYHSVWIAEHHFSISTRPATSVCCCSWRCRGSRPLSRCDPCACSRPKWRRR